METQSVYFYKNDNGQTNLEVCFSGETVWLNRQQMAQLFNRNVKTISKHISNIYEEGELEAVGTTATVDDDVSRNGQTYKRQIKLFNLDVVISVGYRVKSREGIQFRIWATKTLHQHLRNGYTIQERRLLEQQERLRELQRSVLLLREVSHRKELDNDQTTALLRVITDYAYALQTLDNYDLGELRVENTTQTEAIGISYEEAMLAIRKLAQKQGSRWFGQPKDQSFDSSLSVIFQTFDGLALYPSIEEKAAHLLYFVVKNHSFVDGNKRIAAFLFIWFLDRNRLLYNKYGDRRIADNALVALTLLIAESRHDDKDTIVKLIVSLINKNN